jgi:hypothetical protein
VPGLPEIAGVADGKRAEAGAHEQFGARRRGGTGVEAAAALGVGLAQPARTPHRLIVFFEA